MSRATKPKSQADVHAALRRKETLEALRDGRKPGRGGFHKSKKQYDRKRDRRDAVKAAW